MKFFLKHFDTVYMSLIAFVFGAFLGWMGATTVWESESSPAVTPVAIEESVGPVGVGNEWLIRYFWVNKWAEERAVVDGYDDYAHHADQLVGAASLCVEFEAEIAFAIDNAVDEYLGNAESSNPLYIIILSKLYGAADIAGGDVSCLGLLPAIIDDVKNLNEG